DNSGTGGTSCGSTPCSSLTFPYTVNSNTNGLIIVNVGLNDYTDSVTGVSYGGHALTFYGDAYDVTVGAVSVWYMLGELSGTNNVVINASSAHIFGATAASYTGVSQTGLPDAVGTGSPQDHTSADGLFAGSVTTVANNAWAFLALAKNGGATPTAGSNTTLRVDDTNDGSDSLYDSGGPVTPGGSTATLNVNTGASNKSIGVYFSFAPASTAIWGGSGTTTFTYDKDGNLTSNGTSTFIYDYRNELTAV